MSAGAFVFVDGERTSRRRSSAGRVSVLHPAVPPAHAGGARCGWRCRRRSSCADSSGTGCWCGPWRRGPPTGHLPGGLAGVGGPRRGRRRPGALRPTPGLRPGPRDALSGVAVTRDRVLTTTLDNVRGRACVHTPTGNGWSRARIDLPDNAAIGLGAADRNGTTAFLSVTGFLDAHHALVRSTPPRANVARSKALPARFDASQPRGGAVRGDVAGRHEDPVLRRPPEGHAARRQQPDAPLRLRRLPGLADAQLLRRTWASSGWSAAASTWWPTSAAAASSARPGTRPACKTKRQRDLRRLRRGGGGPDRAEDHQPAPARHPGRLERRPADGRGA